MLEVSAGVYVAQDMSSAVRDRVWDVVSGVNWHLFESKRELGDTSIFSLTA